MVARIDTSSSQSFRQDSWLMRTPFSESPYSNIVLPCLWRQKARLQEVSTPPTLHFQNWFKFQTDIHRTSLQKLILLWAINDDKRRVIQKFRFGKERFCFFSIIRCLKTGVHIVEKGKLIVSDVQVEIAIGIALGVEVEFEIPDSHVIKVSCVMIFLVLPICLEAKNDVTRLLQLRWLLCPVVLGYREG